MREAKHSLLTGLLPSWTDVAFVMPMAFLLTGMRGAATLLSDGDTGWHVRTGEWILDHHRIPFADLFSFTKPGEPWFAWEWLADVLFGALHRSAGMAAVVLASVLVICSVCGTLFRLVRRNCPNVLIGIAVTLTAAAASSIHWLARPHLFTLVFAVIFYGVLERARESGARCLAWLPPLTAVWANLHGGFVLAPMLAATYGVAEFGVIFLENAAAEPRKAFQAGRRYLLCAAGCLAASLANPYGWRLHVHLWRYLKGSYEYRHIEEFQSISFHPAGARYFECLLLLGAAAGFWHLARGRLRYPLLIAGFSHLALISARHIPLFAIIVAPPLAQAICEWAAALADSHTALWLRGAARGLQDRAGPWSELDDMPRLHLCSIAGAALFAVALFSPAAAGRWSAAYDPARYPEGALQYLERAGRAGRLFTQDDWGDYIIYRQWPARRVFVDGRSDFYGTAFCERYAGIMEARAGWEERLRSYGVSAVLVPPGAPVAAVLKQSRGWRTDYDDGVAIVFRAAAESGAGRGREITKLSTRDLPIPGNLMRSDEQP